MFGRLAVGFANVRAGTRVLMPVLVQANNQRASTNSATMPRSVFYPQNHVGRGWGTRNGARGAVRLPKILVLTIDDSLSAQKEQDMQKGTLQSVVARPSPLVPVGTRLH